MRQKSDTSGCDKNLCVCGYEWKLLDKMGKSLGVKRGLEFGNRKQGDKRLLCSSSNEYSRMTNSFEVLPNTLRHSKYFEVLVGTFETLLGTSRKETNKRLFVLELE